MSSSAIIPIQKLFGQANSSKGRFDDVQLELGSGDYNLRDAILPGFLALVVIYLISTFIRTAIPNKLDQLPGPKHAKWTSLHLRYMFARGTIWRYVERAHAKYGDVARLGPRQVWVSSKEALKAILVTTDLPKVTMYAEISRDRYSPGLFGEIRPKPHSKLKRFLGPAFTVSSVDQLDSFFKACTSNLLECYYGEMKKASKSKSTTFTTDLMRDLHCLALDIMGESAFGKGFGQIQNIFNPAKNLSAREKAWMKIPNNIFDGLADRYRMVFVKRALRKLGWDVKFDWPGSMIKAISELVDERRAEADAGKSQDRIDVLQHMLDEGNRPDTGETMSNRDIIDQMSELLLAGSETTSGTIGCLFLELARNPKVRAKLMESLPVLTPKDEILDRKTVREQPVYRYLEACIKENLRMHPIASEMGRRTIQEPFVADGMEIPPYTVVSASYRFLHLNERYWPQADRFWPERWLEGEEREDAPEPDEDAYYPFSGGKHGCIGKNFAYAEIRTVSANILSRFDVEEKKYKEIDFRQFITMQFHDGSWNALLKPRWTENKA